MPTTAEGQRNTLYLLDLKTGKLLRKAVLPWRSAVFDLWLGPDGESAILSETEADESSMRTDVTLTRVGLEPDRITRTALADPTRTQGFTTSLDGRTVAAVLTGAPGAPAELRAWNIATGAQTGHVPRLDPEEADGTLALNSTGTAAWFSLLPDFSVDVDTDLFSSTDGPGSDLSIRSLATGKRIGSSIYPRGWSTLMPLGDSPDDPILLADGTALGFVSAASSGWRTRPRPAPATPSGTPTSTVYVGSWGPRSTIRGTSRSWFPPGRTTGPCAPEPGVPTKHAYHSWTRCRMAEIARWSLDNGGEVLVEIAEDGPEISPVSRSRDVVRSAATSLGSALSSVRDASSTILGQFRDAPVRPDKIEVEFGVRLSTEAGAVIAKSSLDGHLTVKLCWEGGRAAQE